MSDGTISENTATTGGGIYVGTSNANITGGSYITDNTASGDGGGFYIAKTGKLNITGTNHITDNTAGADGGGIYTADTTYTNISSDYANLDIDNSTVFSGNKASTAYTPPPNATTLYPNIGFSSTSIENHPLNNYDINYRGAPQFNITYDANGGTGSYVGPYVPYGTVDTVLSQNATGISHDGYTFTGWNTEPDGSGTSYSPDDKITLDSNVTLYAQWKAIDHTVNFESNGGSSVDDQTVPHGDTSTKPNDPTRECYIFEGWYTDDGTFENEWDFSTPITEDVTLYAKWVEDPNCKQEPDDDKSCCKCQEDKPCDICKSYCKHKKCRPSKKECNPKTGSTDNILLSSCICLCIISIIGISILVKKFKNK